MGGEEKLIEKGVIRKSTAGYAGAGIAILKRSGDVGHVVDYGKVNA